MGAYLGDADRPLRDRLVVHYTPLVRAVAHRVAAGLPSYVEHADLVQSGVFGLIDAVMRFDPERSPRFESYAAQRIRGAILDELRAQDWVPRSVRGRARELERAQERLEGRLLRGATERELAAELGVTLRDLAGLTRQVQLVSVEALHESSGGVSSCSPTTTPPTRWPSMQARETMRQLAAAVGAARRAGPDGDPAVLPGEPDPRRDRFAARGHRVPGVPAALAPGRTAARAAQGAGRGLSGSRPRGHGTAGQQPHPPAARSSTSGSRCSSRLAAHPPVQAHRSGQPGVPGLQHAEHRPRADLGTPAHGRPTGS